MRTFYLLIFALLIGRGMTFAQSGWYASAQLSGNYSISAIDFAQFSSTSSALYITANNNSQGFVLQSTDKGQSWSVDTFFSYPLYAVEIAPGGEVYVAGSSGKIYKRALSGTWSQLTTGTSYSLYDIQFVSSTTGYAVGSSGTFLKTVNGGSSWSNPTQSGGQPSYDYNSVYFTSANNGVVVGTYNFYQGFSIQTVSGGQYWGVPVNFPSYLNKVTFTSSTTGYAVGNGGVIYKTTNSGAGWILKTSGVTAELNDISMANDSVGYVVGANGTILKTTNGGNSWATQPSPFAFDLQGIYAYAEDTAWAVGDTVLILKTNTGGIGLSVTAADTSVYCQGYAQLSTTVSYNGSGTLQYSWAANAALSSTNTATPLAGPLSQSTTFYVTVTDGTLSASDSCTVSITTLPADSICLVSVLDSTNDNIIVFEKHVQGPIAYYKIFKESSVANVYDSIGYIPADSAGLYIDTAVNPQVQAYRYKISSVDSCGNETAMSNAHKTIHLTINQGLPGQWNLIWNNYEGVFINTYRIWRSDSLGNWSLIDSVAGNMTSYTDLNPPSGSIFYQIEVISSYMCLPYNYKAQTNYNTSRSNRANTGAPPSISADFNATPLTGTAPLTVNFSDASQGNIDHWFWDFGDGDTAMTANPSHTYTSPGVYDVTLKIHSGILVDSVSKSAYIDVVSSLQGATQVLRLKVYPNPGKAGERMIVESHGLKLSAISLFNIVGQQVFKKAFKHADKADFIVPEALKGIFFMEATLQDGRKIQRKVIIR